VAVIDRLSASLCKLMGRALPRAVFLDRSGVVRVACTQPTYAGLIEADFNQIRQNGAGTPIVVLHLLEAIGRIAEHVQLPAQHAALSEQAKVIVEVARPRIEDDFDRKRIEDYYLTVQRSLDRAPEAWAGQAGSAVADRVGYPASATGRSAVAMPR
jgi:uncharacterized membrane protein